MDPRVGVKGAYRKRDISRTQRTPRVQWGLESSVREKQVQVDPSRKGAQSPAQPLATLPYPAPPPHVLCPRRLERGCAPPPTRSAARGSHCRLATRKVQLPSWGGRGTDCPRPPTPSLRLRPRSAKRAAFPVARVRRAHQTCSTFSQPPSAVTLPPSVRPGPAGPTEVAITTDRNAPTYTKPAGRGGHAAPAPRPLQPRGAKDASQGSPAGHPARRAYSQ